MPPSAASASSETAGRSTSSSRRFATEARRDRESPHSSNGSHPVPGRGSFRFCAHPHPAVRFWAATLLGPYPELGREGLIALTWDPDPNVRAAAVETLGSRSGNAVGAATARAAGRPRVVRAGARRARRRPRRGRRGRAVDHAVFSPTGSGGCERRRRTRSAAWAPTPCRRSLPFSGIRTRSRETAPPRFSRTSDSSTPLATGPAGQPASRADLRGGRRAAARSG